MLVFDLVAGNRELAASCQLATLATDILVRLSRMIQMRRVMNAIMGGTVNSRPANTSNRVNRYRE